MEVLLSSLEMQLRKNLPELEKAETQIDVVFTKKGKEMVTY
jgi:hypothetical protein